MCVYVCVFICLCMFVCAYMCVCLCVSVSLCVPSQRLTAGIYLNNFPFYFGDRVSHWTSSSLVWLDWEPPSSTPTPNNEITGCVPTLYFHLHSGHVHRPLCSEGSSIRLSQPTYDYYPFCSHFCLWQVSPPPTILSEVKQLQDFLIKNSLTFHNPVH